MHADTFDQAVRLAAAFVANGDIRLGLDFEEGSHTQKQLADLMETLCHTLERARQMVSGGLVD